jgi:hypothetical protein
MDAGNVVSILIQHFALQVVDTQERHSRVLQKANSNLMETLARLHLVIHQVYPGSNLHRRYSFRSGRVSSLQPLLSGIT